jgi:hypothetical protein
MLAVPPELPSIHPDLAALQRPSYLTLPLATGYHRASMSRADRTQITPFGAATMLLADAPGRP